MQEKPVRKLTFAEVLGGLMAERNVNASELARAVGVSHVAIGNLIKGQMPRSELLHAIATHFGVSMDYFFGGPREPRGWDPSDPLPESLSLDQIQAMRDHSVIAANALAYAQKAGKLSEVGRRVASLENEARELRRLMDDVIGAGVIEGQPAVRYSDTPPKTKLSSTAGTDTAAHARMVGARPESRRPASRGPGGTTGGPSASVPAPAAPPLPGKGQ